jgi:predicted alpha/beta hydrolase
VSTVTDVTITTPDGQALAATLHAPSTPAQTWLLINSAMAVPRRFYRHLAAHLNADGIGVLTYDYRGMGDSVLRGAAHGSTRLADWGRHDFPAVLAWLTAQQKPVRTVVLGHSVGGQILGLAPEILGVHAIVGVATQAGYWGHWTGIDRFRVFLLWHAAIPLLTPLFGHFPARAVGLGGRLPPGVAREWAAWGRDRDYLRSRTIGPQPQFFDSVTCPLRTYAVAGDPLAPAAAVRAWHHWFPAARRELIEVPPVTTSGEPVGHFGFFAPGTGAGLWPDLSRFVRG